MSSRQSEPSESLSETEPTERSKQTGSATNENVTEAVREFERAAKAHVLDSYTRHVNDGRGKTSALDLSNMIIEAVASGLYLLQGSIASRGNQEKEESK